MDQPRHEKRPRVGGAFIVFGNAYRRVPVP